MERNTHTASPHTTTDTSNSAPPTIERVALVTGACAGGIGHATAVAFAKLGYRVAVTSRSQRRLGDTLRDMVRAAPRASGPTKPEERFVAFEANFMDDSQTDQIVPRVVGKFGRLDILVNNAAMLGHGRGLFDGAFFENYKTVMQVNLMAPTRLAQMAAPHLLRASETCGAGGGVIINVSSIADRLPVVCPAYSISKAGLSMLTKVLANNFEGTGVRALTLCPGPTVMRRTTSASITSPNTIRHYPGVRVADPNTTARPHDGLGKMSTLARRSATTEEIADVIAFLVSDKASYMTGATVDVDGGAHCKAGLLLGDACIRGALEIEMLRDHDQERELDDPEDEVPAYAS